VASAHAGLRSPVPEDSQGVTAGAQELEGGLKDHVHGHGLEELAHAPLVEEG